ncbi:hypothetical protein BU15DRAFT_68827 [Melanogaster broomeanus]|nr:hypothetical protein BU15DRAFT_68827 [Melanogaster broomeanus]
MTSGHCKVIPDIMGRSRSHVDHPTITGTSMWEVPGYSWVGPGIMGWSFGSAQKSCGQSQHHWKVHLGSPITLMGSPRDHGNNHWEVHLGSSRTLLGNPRCYEMIRWECSEAMWEIPAWLGHLCGKSQDIAGYAQASWEGSPRILMGSSRHYRRVSWECPEVIWVVLAPLGGPSGKFQNIQKSCEQCQHGWTSWEGSPSTTGRSIWEVPEHCWVVPGPRHHEKASWEDQVGMARSHVGNPSMTGMSIWEVPGHCWVVPGIMGRSVGDAQKSYGQSSTTWRSIWEVPGYCWIVLGIMGRHYGKLSWECPEVIWVVQHHLEAHLGSPRTLWVVLDIMGSIIGRSIWEVPQCQWVVSGIMGSSGGNALMSYGQSQHGQDIHLGSPRTLVGFPGIMECMAKMSIWQLPGHCWVVSGIMARSSQYLWESIWEVQEYCWINPRHYEKVTWEYPEVMWVIPAWLKGLSGKFQNTTR